MMRCAILQCTKARKFFFSIYHYHLLFDIISNVSVSLYYKYRDYEYVRVNYTLEIWRRNDDKIRFHVCFMYRPDYIIINGTRLFRFLLLIQSLVTCFVG